MKIGLYFGSFNPIHIGHLAIANYMIEFSDIDKLWFIVSPHNPLKKKKSLLQDYHRLELINIAIGDDIKYFKASDIEFKLPQPSYTIDTLTHLTEKYPNDEFVLIMGSDNLKSFHKWKNHEIIIEKHTRYIYPRPNSVDEIQKHENVKIIEAPLMDISSSFIRKSIKEKKRVKYFLPNNVYNYICDMHFYEK